MANTVRLTLYWVKHKLIYVERKFSGSSSLTLLEIHVNIRVEQVEQFTEVGLYKSL